MQLSMLDAVYVDAREIKSIIAVKPKPLFKSIFRVAATREKSDISIVNEPYKSSALFLVETGDVCIPPETLSKWLMPLSVK